MKKIIPLYIVSAVAIVMILLLATAVSSIRTKNIQRDEAMTQAAIVYLEETYDEPMIYEYTSYFFPEMLYSIYFHPQNYPDVQFWVHGSGKTVSVSSDNYIERLYCYLFKQTISDGFTDIWGDTATYSFSVYTRTQVKESTPLVAAFNVLQPGFQISFNDYTVLDDLQFADNLFATFQMLEDLGWSPSNIKLQYDIEDMHYYMNIPQNQRFGSPSAIQKYIAEIGFKSYQT